jgi:outer membrane protein assembly factor BamB
MVYSAAGRSGGGLVKLTVEQGSVFPEQIYFTNELPTSIGGAVVVDGYLYGTNRRGLLCADFASGEIKWQERSVGAGSLCYADGNLYVHGEQENDLTLVEATPQEFRKKGHVTPPHGSDHSRIKAWSYPVIANGRLYVHDVGTLWCYDIAAR